MIKLVQVIDPVSKETDHFYKDLSAGPAWFGRACKACKLKRYRNDCGAHYNKKRPVPGNSPAPHRGVPFKFASVHFKKNLYVVPWSIKFRVMCR